MEALRDSKIKSSPKRPASGALRCFAFIAAFVLLIPVAALSSDGIGWKWIEGGSVRNMLKEGSALWLIDLRGSSAYDSEHIEGSVNIPASFLQHRGLPRNKTIVLVDDYLGQRISREAADELVKEGYEKVYVLNGGIVLWRLEGFPVVEKKPVVRGVTRDELKWAIENNIALRILDLRDVPEREKEKMPNSEGVPGKDIAERAGKLKAMIKKSEGGSLSERLKKHETIILLTSASVDAASVAVKIAREVKEDVRYLIGGYAVFAGNDKKPAGLKGSCPTCPGK